MANVTIQRQLLHEIAAHVIECDGTKIETFVHVQTQFTDRDGEHYTETVNVYIPLDIVQLTHWAEQLESAAADLRALVRKVTADASFTVSGTVTGNVFENNTYTEAAS